MPDVPPEDNVVDKILQSNAENGRNPWTTSSGGQQVVGKDKPSPNLTSQEKTRLEKEATIFAKIQFQVQKLLKGDEEKGETARATPAAAAQQTVKQDKEKKKPFKFPLLAILAAGITAFAAWIADFIGPVAEFISKTLPKLFKPMSKMAGGFFKAMKGGKLMKMLGGIAGKIGGKLMKFGRFIPVIGSLFSFGFGIARWKKGEYIPAIFEFLSGILNLLPFGVTNIASMIIDGALLLYDLDKEQQEKEKLDPTGGSFSLWDKIRGYFLKSPGIQNIISLGKAIGAVFRGDWGEAGKHFLHSLPMIGSILFWLDEAKEGNPQAQTIVGKVSDFFKAVGDKIVSFFKSIADGIWDGLKGVGDMYTRLGKAMWAGTKALAPGGESPIEAFKRVMAEEADDGAVLRKGNKLIRFNTKDDILAMKPGGAIEKFLKGSDVKTRSLIKDQIGGLPEAVKPLVSELRETGSLIKDEIGGLPEALKPLVSEQNKAVTSSLTGTLKAYAGLFGGQPKKSWRDLKSNIGGLFDKAAGGIGGAVSKLTGLDVATSEIKISNTYLATLVKQMNDLIKIGLLSNNNQSSPPPRMVQAPPADSSMTGGIDQGKTFTDVANQFNAAAYSMPAPRLA